MSASPYIHDLNPVIWQITDSIALRWYGVAYLLGFIAGYFLLSWLSRRKLYPVPQDRLADFVTYVAIFGVLLGGRLGYVLFYHLPNHGWAHLLEDPFMVLRVWEGGMASHGGMIGVGLYTFYYAWKHRVKWVALLDGLAIVAPVGLFFGRMANFINGELYGRIVPPGSSHGMIFPAELAQDPDLFVRVASRIYEEPGLLDKMHLSGISVPEQMNAAWVADRVRDTPAVKEIVAQVMEDHARYPSQLYEAFAEGVVLFAVLWFIRVKFPRAWNGVFCGVFAIVYAIGRIVCEEFREPDSPFSMGMTRGQFLSVFLIFVGLAFLVYAFKTRKTVQDCVFYDPAEKSAADEEKKSA
ncbi:MAG: prolipoprotein diacylglyceryl transferase [Akkermansia sp.]|nr:prolipoprotein diacylglyceryl transferase [Akkermansia sp.]